MKNLALHWKIIIGMVLGIIWALVSSSMGWSEFTLNWIDPFGVIFINLLKLIAVPLVLFSIIGGVSGIQDTGSLGKMGAKTLFAYLLTTVLAISTGLLLVNIINPGELVDDNTRKENRISYELWAKANGEQILDGQCLSCQPEWAAQAERIAKKLEMEPLDDKIAAKMTTAEQRKKAGPLQALIDIVPSNIFTSLNNNGLMLQVIFFAIFFGVSLVLLPEEHRKPVRSLINGINEVFLKMVDLIMKAAPFFVFALLAGQMSKMAPDDPMQVIEIFKGLGWYSLAVVLGLGTVVFVYYGGAIALFVKKMTYGGFFRGMAPAQTLAFSTASSAATLPVTMDCVEENLGVSSKVTSFVLPIGATINMDGTSLYQAVAVVFLAQLHMVDLTLGQQLTIVLTATLASIGSAAVPGAGLVMLIIVLQSVGLNPAWIAIVFPVDRILDMCRTAVNVTGDATVSTLIASSEGELDYKPEGEE